MMSSYDQEEIMLKSDGCDGCSGGDVPGLDLISGAGPWERMTRTLEPWTPGLQTWTLKVGRRRGMGLLSMWQYQVPSTWFY